MNTDRDRFLTEQMGKCWHEPGKSSKIRPDGDYYCRNCRQLMPNCDSRCWNPAFSTWTGFGVLKEWMEKHERWEGFMSKHGFTDCIDVEYIDPDRFANAVYAFFKEAK